MQRASSMKATLRKAGLLLVAVGIGIIAEAPLAQEQKTTTKDGYLIEEVFVTVSKRQESLQEVLGSVSAFDGDTLNRNNVQDFASLVDLVPGMVAQDEDKIAIRGISRTRDGPSPVAFHVNDVFIAQRGEPFYDLGAVEILRGPSGTLFGRNATAGAINVKWRQPESQWSAGGSVRSSGLEERQFRGFVNIPLLGEDDPRLLARAAAMVRRGDGTLDNLLVPDNEDPNNVRDQFLRLYLTSEVTENVQLGLRAIHSESEPRGSGLVFTQSLHTRRSGEYQRLGAQPLPDDVTKVRSTTANRYGEGFAKTTRIDGDITWSVQDLPWFGDVDVVAVGGVQRSNNMALFDLDGTEEPIVDGFTRTPDDRRRSAELRFVSQNDSGFDWLVGLFWYKQTATTDMLVEARTFVAPTDLVALPGPSLPLSGGIVQSPIFDVDVIVDGEHTLDHSKALFLNMDFDLAKLLDWQGLELTVGLRQNRDKFSKNTEYSDILITSYDFGGPSSSVGAASNLVQKADFTESTGEIGFRWFYSDEGMLYSKLSRGYKPGLAQTVARPDGAIIQNPVGAEYLNALELGWKTSFFNRALVMSSALYRYDYNDLQVSQITPGGVITDNAGIATLTGFEVESQWSPNQAFYLQASMAWSQAEYDEYCGSDPALGNDPQIDPGCNSENPTDFSGVQLPAAPQLSAALLATYTFDLGEFGTLMPSLKTSWTDELDRRGLGNPHDRIRSHSTSDFRLAWNSLNRRWQVEAFVENIENNDDIYFQAFAPAVVGGQPDLFTLGAGIPPRIYGVTVEYLWE